MKTDLRLRPRFDLIVAVEPNDVLRRLDTVLRDPSAAVTGKVFASSAVLTVPPDAVHFWSPQLSVSVDPHLPSGSVVHGLFGPRPTIWSLFVALYVGIAFAGSMGVIYGWAEWTLGGSGMALWSGPTAAAAAALVYAAGQMGRRLGMEQMRQLKQLLTHTLRP